MGYATEESYEMMIEELGNYKTAVVEKCADMKTAAQDCADNTHEDDTVVSAQGKVGEAVASIESNLATVDKIISALEAQLEALREAQKKRDNS